MNIYYYYYSMALLRNSKEKGDTESSNFSRFSSTTEHCFPAVIYDYVLAIY